MCINAEYRSSYNSCFSVSTELSPFTEWNYMYIRREFTDVILKKISKVMLKNSTSYSLTISWHTTSNCAKKASVCML